MDHDFRHTARPAELRQVRMQENRVEELLLADASPQPPTRKPLMQVSQQGQIAKMDLPADWSKLAEREQSMTLKTGIDFQLPGRGELSFFERGQRISENAAGSFHKTLNASMPAAADYRTVDISAKDGELPGLKALLNELGNSNKFEIDKAMVRTISGKRVLQVSGEQGYRDDDGNWTGSGIQVSNFYIDKFGTGDAIQEIRLTAPKASFHRLMSDLDKALHTIDWKR